MKAFIASVVLTTLCACAMTPYVATTRIDEEDVEIEHHTSSGNPSFEERLPVLEEAALRCGLYDRFAEYVSVRWRDETRQGSFQTHIVFTYLFQCIPHNKENAIGVHATCIDPENSGWVTSTPSFRKACEIAKELVGSEEASE